MAFRPALAICTACRHNKRGQGATGQDQGTQGGNKSGVGGCQKCMPGSKSFPVESKRCRRSRPGYAAGRPKARQPALGSAPREQAHVPASSARAFWRWSEHCQPSPPSTHLIARHGAQGVHVGLSLEQLPQLLSAALRQGVLHLDAAAQALHILLRVWAQHAVEAAGRGLDVHVRHGGGVCNRGGERRRKRG